MAYLTFALCYFDVSQFTSWRFASPYQLYDTFLQCTIRKYCITSRAQAQNSIATLQSFFFFFFPWCSLCSASGSKPRRPYILLLNKLLTRPDEVSGLSMIFLTIKYLYFPSCSGVTILLTFTPSLLHSPTPALPRSLAPLLPLSFIPSLFHSFTLSLFLSLCTLTFQLLFLSFI